MSLLRQPSSYQPRSIHMKSFNYYWIPPILWAAFIFIASSNSNPLGPLPEEAIPVLKAIRILGFRLDNIIWAVSHIFEYAVLAFLVARALGFRRFLSMETLALAFAVTLLYGVSDEIHQVFVPGRGFEWIDLLADGVGSGVGSSLWLVDDSW